MTIPPPPPGFELEPMGQGAAMPPPPPGFELIADDIIDLPQVNALPPDFSGVTGSADSTADIVGKDVLADGWRPGLARDVALGGRSVLRGAGSLLGMVGGDAFNHYIANPIERATGLPQSGSFRDAGDAVADNLGLPKAQNASERVLGDVGEALTGTGLTMGIGGSLNALANIGRGANAAPVPASRLSSLLTTQPTMQAVSAATGSGAAGITRESGGSQGQQLVAGLAGGLGPSLAATGGGALARLAVRGTDGSQMRSTLADFQALGAQPSVGQASGNRLIQGAENLLAGGPTSAGVMGRFAERQADDIGAGLQRQAANLQPNASAERAGRAVQAGVDTFSKNVAAQRRALYWDADRHIPAGAGSPMQNTTQTLAQLTAPNPGAAETTARLVNPKLRQMLDDLQADLQAGGGQVPYEALRKIRTSIGEQMSDFSMTPDTPAVQLRALYGALSRDMEAVAKAAGPAAERAARRANNYTRLSAQRMEHLQTVVDKAGGGEAVYNAVMAGSKDGGTRLREVMQSLPKGSQQALTAAVIKRMGMPTPGQAGVDAAEQFSAATFLTNWNRVSPEARRALFDRHGPEFSRNMDRIARVAANLKDGAKVFANPSGTANRAAALTYGASLVGGLVTGNLAWPVAAGVMTNVSARLLTNPRVVRMLAEATEMPRSGVVATARQLHALAQYENDPEIEALASALANSPEEELQ